MDSSSDDDEEAPEPEPATLLVQPEHARGAIGRGTQRRNRMQNAPVRQQISQVSLPLSLPPLYLPSTNADISVEGLYADVQAAGEGRQAKAPGDHQGAIPCFQSRL